MKNMILALALFATPASAGGLEFGPDKVIHFGLGYAAVKVGEQVAPDVPKWVWSCGLGVFIEAVDVHGTGWDNKDILFTCLAGLPVFHKRWEW